MSFHDTSHRIDRNPGHDDADALTRLARRRARAKLGWYRHAIIYLLVNLGLNAFALAPGGHWHWRLYTALGWGLGLMLHGLSVWVLGPGSDAPEQMVARERARLQRNQRN